MMKQILKLSILLLFFIPLQKVEGQDIIMGSAPLVADIGDSPRYFYDPGGEGYFTPGLDVTMTLRTEAVNAQLYVLFEEFAIGDRDTLWIYDGASVNAPLLGCYSLMNSPGEILASGRDMTFVFHSGNEPVQGLLDGWKAQVYAYNSQPLEINYGEWTSVLTCNADFYDAGGPSGNIGTAVPDINFTEFTSPIGTHIKCEFEGRFQAAGLLRIYDGVVDLTNPADIHHNQRLIGQFLAGTNGTLPPAPDDTIPTFFSTTNTLCFVYEGASGDANKPGWKAHISCVPELLEYDEYNYSLGISNILLGDYADAANQEVIVLDTLRPVVLLHADMLATGQFTNDYTVKQIPYNEQAMLFDYNAGQPVNAQNDDQWLAPVDLNECSPTLRFLFFGQIYDKLYPSSNGIVSFNQQSQGATCVWNTENYIPAPRPPYTYTPYCYQNSAYLLYEDVNPNPTYCYPTGGFNNGTIRVGVVGDFPCRAFVFNYDNVGLYSCCTSSNPDYFNTYQMVLLEGSGIIDVYIKHRACCTSWNGGRGVIGLQNKTSSQIVTPPNRDFGTTANPIAWSADHEAWRFTPVTPPAEYGELTWYKDTVDEEHIFSYSPTAKNQTIAVRPTATTSYISEYKYVDATGYTMEFRDTTLVLVPEPIDSTSVAVRNADFTVWPNPTHDAVYVKLQSTREMPSAIEVLDLNGRLLFAVPAQETTRVDLSRLSSGFYLLKAAGGKGAAVKIAKR